MRKIRCPRCAVINMEGFTTFPYCAACGTLLPDAANRDQRGAWRRPLRSTLWATVIGGTVLALALSATHFFEAPQAGNAALVVYGRAPRTITVGESFSIQLMLDRSKEGISAPNIPFKNLTVRLPDELLRNFRLRSVQPPPDAVEQRGNGHYYEYLSLPADAVIQISLVSRNQGLFGVPLRVLSDGDIQTEKSNEYYAVINVLQKSSSRRVTRPSRVAQPPKQRQQPHQ
jgi:hypothetical protein